jgi:hypothetical protein
MRAMRKGDFRRAWTISDALLAARLARGDAVHQGPRHFQSIWNGASLTNKRVLVRCYHGLGDTIQFIRFAAPLRRIASEVTVWAQQPLVRLLAGTAGVDRILPLHDGTPDVEFDRDIEIMELAHALRVDAQTIACQVPYIFPPTHGERPARSARELLVGLVWKSGGWDDRRSVPARLLSRLAHVSGVRLFSVQCGASAAEAASIPAEDISSEDVEETAASLQGLDLLISVDTFAAHLAAALGHPVWLLLHSQCDWRWMNHGNTSIWYPTMRLFRQRRPAEWEPVVEEIAAALAHAVAARESSCKSFGTNLSI